MALIALMALMDLGAAAPGGVFDPEAR